MTKNYSNININLTLNNNELSTTFSSEQTHTQKEEEKPKVLDYNELVNKPKINNVTLIDNKTSDDLNVLDQDDEVPVTEILALF